MQALVKSHETKVAGGRQKICGRQKVVDAASSGHQVPFKRSGA